MPRLAVKTSEMSDYVELISGINVCIMFNATTPLHLLQLDFETIVFPWNTMIPICMFIIIFIKFSGLFLKRAVAS